MEPEVIRNHVFKRVHELSKETQTLYELSESDMILLTTLMLDMPLRAISLKLLARLLRAAAHFIERNHDIAEEIEVLRGKKS